MNLRRLEQLVAVAEEGSFVRAAERAHLSQPALSRSIQSLEHELGVRLFDRTSGGVLPTAAGQHLVDRARRVLVEMRGLRRDADLIRDHELGDVHFGAGAYASATLLPELLPRLVNRHPRLKVRAETSDWDTLLRKVVEEELDFAVLEQRTIPPDLPLISRPLSREPAGWYVRRGHPLARRRDLTPLALADFPLVSVPLPGVTRAGLARALGQAHGEALALSLECNDLALLRDLVSRSDAVFSATESLCQRAPAGEQLVRLDMASGRHEVVLVAVLLSHRTPSPATERTLAVVEELVGETPRPSPTTIGAQAYR